MAQLDAIRKYLEAGMAFTQTTRAKAEEVVGNLVRAGELQTEQTQQQVQELVERSRENTERVVKAMREEVVSQMASLGFATKKDLARLERKVDAMKSSLGREEGSGEEGGQEVGREEVAGSDGQEGPREEGSSQEVVTARRRLDAELVRRGLAASREAAQRAIDAGLVTVGGAPAEKASRMVGAGEPVEVLGPPPRFVSRGGDKLAEALQTFGIDVDGRRALDAGASTGGFTDCLLQARRGAGRRGRRRPRADAPRGA